MAQVRFLSIILGLLMVASIAIAQEEPPLAGDTRIDDFGVAQVYVPAGCFAMGTSDTEADYARTLESPSWAVRRLRTEQPQHEVCLTQGYWIDQFEVTRESFQAFVDADGYTTEALWSEDGLDWLDDQNIEALLARCPDETEPTHPQVCITWYEAQAYATWRGGQLPTEAQWEFAARGTESLIYPWGNEWDTTRANVEGSSGLTPVGSYPDGVSWVGAHDMAGNAMEWVNDWLSNGYADLLDQVNDPTGIDNGRIRVEKGGWWGSNPLVARSAYRHFEDPSDYFDHHIGFRVVTLAPSEE